MTDGYLEDIERRRYREQIQEAQRLIREAEERLQRVQSIRESHYTYQYRTADEVALQKMANTHRG